MRIKYSFFRLLALLPIIIIWYILSYFAPRYLMPYPHDVVIALVNLFLNHNLLQNILLSLSRVVIGFCIGVFLGILFGVIALFSKIVKDLFYPIISFIIVIPAFAFIPLLMIWIGLNDLLPIVAVIICTAFPLIYSLVSASKNIDPEMIDIAIVLGASRSEIIKNIVLPLSISHITSLLRVEAGHSWRIVFVTEFLALPNGLGALMMHSYSLLKVDEIIALIIIIGLLTLGFQYIIEYIEYIILKRWGRKFY